MEPEVSWAKTKMHVLGGLLDETVGTVHARKYSGQEGGLHGDSPSETPGLGVKGVGKVMLPVVYVPTD